MKSFVTVGLLAAFLTLLTSTTTHAAFVGVDIVDIGWQVMGFSPFGASGAAAADRHMRDACITANLTWVRFAATPFWPNEMKAALFNGTQAANEYWSGISNLVAMAEKHGCRLLPSLFWMWWTPSDVHGEHLGESMRNASSKTRAFLVQYVQKFIATVGNSKAIVAWELGNELNLLADLNMSGKAGHPQLGQPAFRTSADNFSTDDMIAFETWLAQDVIQRYDPQRRPVSTGHAVSRFDAEHLRRSYHQPQRNWGADTKAEYQKNLLDTAACCELVSVHFYPGHGARWGIQDPNSTELLAVAASTLAAANSNNGRKKTLYVGEFGNQHPGAREFSHSVLNRLGEIQDSGVLPPSQISASIWVWEFFQFSTVTPADFSLLPGRDDAMIAAMQSFNAKYDV